MNHATPTRRTHARRTLATVTVAAMLTVTGGAAYARTCDPGEDPGDDTTGASTSMSTSDPGTPRKERTGPPATIPGSDTGRPGGGSATTPPATGEPTGGTPASTSTGGTSGTTSTSTSGTTSTGVPNRVNEPFTDKAGTESTYHLFTSAVKDGNARGLVVYLDGDGQNGIKKPESPWALGGPKGVPEMVGALGYATLAPMAPGGDTWYKDGAKNAAWVAELVKKIQTETGTTYTVLVGYSGGAQEITKYVLPDHGDLLAGGGGAVITGGGGPNGGADKSAAPKATTRLLFKTGDRDTGTGSENYDALADSKKGAAEYKAAGFDVTEEHPAGLTHDGLGGEFGTITAAFLTAHPAPATSTPGATTGTPNAPTTATPDGLHDLAYTVTATAENSSTDWRAQAGYIEYNVEKNATENRGYTGGIVGFTSKTSDMLAVVEAYAKDHPDAPLAAFVPALKAADGTVSVAGLGAPYIAAWKAAADTDPAFLATQIREADRVYWTPALDAANTDGLGALGTLAYFDAIVMHGPGDDPGSFGGIRKAAAAKAKTPKDGGDEKTYLAAFLDARAAAMGTEKAHEDTTRVDAQRAFLTAGNLALTGTLEWTVYGQKFTAPGLTNGTQTGATPGAAGPTQDTPKGDTEATERQTLVDKVKGALDDLVAFVTRSDPQPEPAPTPTTIPTPQPLTSGPNNAPERVTPNRPTPTETGTPTGTPSGESAAPKETR